MKRKWETPLAPRPSGRIAQVSIADELSLAYVSGLISQDKDGNILYGKTPAEQTEIILDNLKIIANELGLNMDHVIKTNIFLTDMNDFDEMNQVYSRYFSADNPPARQCVQSGVWGGLAVEISAVLVLQKK